MPVDVKFFTTGLVAYKQKSRYKFSQKPYKELKKMDLGLFRVFNRILIQEAKRGVALLLFKAYTSLKAPSDGWAVLWNPGWEKET